MKAWETVNGIPIQSCTGIDSILNVVITSAGWTEIAVPADVFVKTVYLTTRDGSNFLLSHVANGATYSTLPSGFGIDLIKTPEKTLFYIKGTASTTLEVILFG